MPCRTTCITMLPTCNEEHLTHSVVSDSTYCFGYIVRAKHLRFTTWLHQYYIWSHHKLQRKGSMFNNNVKIRHVWVSNFWDRVEKQNLSISILMLIFHSLNLRIFWSLLLLCTLGSCQKGSVLYLPKRKIGFHSFTSYKFFGLCHEFEWYI
jgi:hypothetical protein